jgi:radical SAM-linked protein
MPMSDPGMILQRLRVRHSKESLAKYISHLDLMRVWERALRRAAVPVAYSRGFNPRPRMAFAAALPVGFSSEAEVLEVSLTRPLPPLDFVKKVSPQLPEGVSISSVEVVPLTLPSLQSSMRQAEYLVRLATDAPFHAIRGRMQRLLSVESIPRRRRHKGKIRSYDLRPLIDDLWLEGRSEDGIDIGMRLQLSSQATGRPDDVVEALGYAEDAVSIHRTRLIWDEA